MKRTKWPWWERAQVGNCPFCWAAVWNDNHEKVCAKRQKAYYAKEKNKH